MLTPHRPIIGPIAACLFINRQHLFRIAPRGKASTLTHSLKPISFVAPTNAVDDHMVDPRSFDGHCSCLYELLAQGVPVIRVPRQTKGPQ